MPGRVRRKLCKGWRWGVTGEWTDEEVHSPTEDMHFSLSQKKQNMENSELE
jgi:hypothetical protein